jgi:glycosyltransferase involved in cell wall biosynthesis
MSAPQIIKAMSRVCARTLRSDYAWLFLVAMSGSFPKSDDVLELVGRFSVSGEDQSFIAALEGSLSLVSNSRFTEVEIELVENTTVVDVNFTAQNGLNTGVQRVIRQTLMRWDEKYEHTLLVWTYDGQAMRPLTDRETQRVRNWDSSMRFELSPAHDNDVKVIAVPWKSRVLIPEVALHKVIPTLSAMTQFSGNTITLIGHDAIPVLSPEDVLPEEAERFAHFLSVVKYSQHVMCVSHSAAEEFSGFVSTLSSQGITGPSVSVVSLPAGKISREEHIHTPLARKRPELPLVLNVGSQEPRKNQTSILVASELLWSKGIEFELIFIGAGSPPLSTSFDVSVESLQKKGRPITVFRHASDSELEEAYEESTMLVFVSLHEGFGLPVAEALAHNTPAVTSNFGSVAEIASEGGCLSVNPRDPEEIAQAMENILLDEKTLNRLHEEISKRPLRTWDDYATELWNNFSERGNL